MRTLTALGMGLLLVACSGSSAQIVGSGADGGLPTDDAAAPSANVTTDGGGEPTFYGSCATTGPLTAGAHTEKQSGLTIHWPAGWLPETEGQVDFNAIGAPYTYVPTGATAAKDAQAQISWSSPIVLSSEADVQKRLDQEVGAGGTGAHVQRITIDGHPAVFWWNQEPPPQPGCMGCAADPGPDVMTIGLAVAVGLNLMELRGAARVNANPAEIFCEIQAIELGVTF